MNPAARAKLRVRFRDFAALSAFSAVALSGALPISVMLVFAACWLSSWFGFRPLDQRRAWSVFLLLAAAAALFGLAYVGALDLIVAAVSFAVTLAAQRLVSEANVATERQVLLASLLLIAGGAALSGEVWYAACLIPFTVSGCFALGLSTIESGDEADIDVAPVMRRLAAGSVVAILGAVLFFVFFPRISWDLSSRRRSPGMLGSVSGMSDTVRLGGAGTIKTSVRVVMRVKLTPSPGDDWLNRYFIGRIFDRFNGTEWQGSGVEQAPTSAVVFGARSSDAIRQEIELLPAYGAQTLLALEAPVSFSNAVALGVSGGQQSLLVESKGEEVRFALAANGFRYLAYSQAPRRSEKESTAPSAQLVSLPDSIDRRIFDLAQDIVKDETRPRQIAQRLERWLKAKYEYTLDLPGAGADPLASFLFERKAGHCEDFATALAVLLRSKGISSRVAAGFYGAERLGEMYVVRAGSAHVWTQAFLPDEGWVDFDATPEAGRVAQPAAIWAQVVSLYESLEDLWRKRVVDYSFQDQLGFARDVVSWRAKRALENPTATGQRSSKSLVVSILAGAAAFALLAWIFGKKPAVAHPATRFLHRLTEALRRNELHLTAGETIEELNHRIKSEKVLLSGPVDEAVQYYLHTRFGSQLQNAACEARLIEQIEQARHQAMNLGSTRASMPLTPAEEHPPADSRSSAK